MNCPKVIVLMLLCLLAVPAGYAQSARRNLKLATEELLRRAIEERAKQQAAGTNQPSLLRQVYHELERQYLAGEITARQFMQTMQELKAFVSTNADPQALSVLPSNVRTHLIAGTNTALYGLGPRGDPDAEFFDIEKKLEELIQRKEQREGATSTNAVPAAPPKTKREKLDALLQLFVREKLTREEYEKRRADIIAGPD